MNNRRNGHKPGVLAHVRAWLLGVEPEKLEVFITLLRGYRPPKGRHNSLILGGPTAWTWNATIDDAHHGSLGGGLHADSHDRQHDMDDPLDHGPGTEGDLVRAGAAGAWELLGVGTDGQVLTVVAGVPDWAAAAIGDHGNAYHTPDFYALDGSEVLTAPLNMQLMTPASEPTAIAGNEGKLYYLTPGAGNEGLIKQIMKNSTGAWEQVQIAISS